MKCPLLAIAWGNLAKNQPVIYPDCLREDCAWWDAALECCIVKSLFCELTSLSELAAGIKEKLPNKADLPK